MEPNQLSTKSIALWGGAALLLAIVVIGAVKLADTGTGDADGATVADLAPITASDWARGASTSPVTLIEFSDFQCPACAGYFPLVERIVSEYQGSIQFVYKHFPLPQHKQAKAAAYAAEAAGKQGKFWEMHALLFENQNEWAGKSDAEKIFESYAERLSLSMEAYRADAASAEVSKAVNDDYLDGAHAGVNATPMFFLNKKKLRNPSSYEGFKQLIDAALPARQSPSDEQVENQ